MMIDGSPDWCLGCRPVEFADRHVEINPPANDAPAKIDNFVTASNSTGLAGAAISRGNAADPFLSFFDVFFFPLRMLFDIGLAVYGECEQIAIAHGGIESFMQSAGSVVQASRPVDSYFTHSQLNKSWMRGH
jgi:hypothetical protein